jgi:hypothetical protein
VLRIEPIDSFQHDRQRRERQDVARTEMAALIESELSALRALRETFDMEAVARSRAGAADRALFDPSKEATLARRYEAAAERGRFRALRELRASETARAAGGGPAPTAVATATVVHATVCEELASFFPAAVPAPPAAKAKPVATKPPGLDRNVLERMVSESDSEGPVASFRVGRPPQGAVARGAADRPGARAV